jgi:hypothetical protein
LSARLILSQIQQLVVFKIILSRIDRRGFSQSFAATSSLKHLARAIYHDRVMSKGQNFQVMAPGMKHRISTRSRESNVQK